MPTHFYIPTSKYIRNLVNTNNFEELDKNLDTEAMSILVYAVEKENKEVIKRYRDKIDVSYEKDGNSYSMITLATEKYTECETEEEKDKIFKMIKFIIKEHKNNKNKFPDLGYPTRLLIKYCHNTGDYRLLDEYINTKCSLWNVFHYSIAWNYKNTYDYINANYPNLIYEDWLDSACETAKDFGNKEMAEYARSISFKKKTR